MLQWGDLFTARQKLVFSSLINIIEGMPAKTDVGKSAKRFSGLGISRLSDINNAMCVWETSKTQVRNLFSRQAVPMHWDFAEPGFFGDNAGNYQVTLETMVRVAERFAGISQAGQIDQADARKSSLSDESSGIWFTDPPYYDAVPYSDLSDFFFVWVKRTLPDYPLLRRLMQTGVLIAVRNCRPNGLRSTRLRPTKAQGITCAPALKPAIRFTRRRFRSFSASGRRFRAIRRRAAHWRCSHSGFRGDFARDSSRRGASLS
jgi:hypothetical protein